MLVISRRESDRVLFPTLGISVEVLRIQGNRARLGISAPPEIPVLRHEIATLKDIEFASDGAGCHKRLRDVAFAVRHRLNTAADALNRLHRHLDKQNNPDAQTMITALFRELQRLEKETNQILEDATVKVQPASALVVEDNACERKLLAAVLELNGFEVFTATDGQDALDYLSMHAPPDVVLLDMVMPRCDGHQFIKEIRSQPRWHHLKILALSGMTAAEADVNVGSGGVDAWFCKPVNPQSLVNEITRLTTGCCVAA